MTLCATTCDSRHYIYLEHNLWKILIINSNFKFYTKKKKSYEKERFFDYVVILSFHSTHIPNCSGANLYDKKEENEEIIVGTSNYNVF